MNWNRIKENCPNALHCFVNKEFPKYKKLKQLGDLDNSANDIYIDTDNGSVIYYLRDLYDFFDSYGIYIYLDPCSCHEQPIWNWCILVNKDEKFLVNEEKSTRLKAETIAFEKAFEILEEKINSNDK